MQEGPPPLGVFRPAEETDAIVQQAEGHAGGPARASLPAQASWREGQLGWATQIPAGNGWCPGEGHAPAKVQKTLL